MTLLGSSVEDNLLAGDGQDLVTEDIRIPSGYNLLRGTVMGRVKNSVPTSGSADSGNTGNGTVTVVTGGGETKKGAYNIECITAEANGGTFKVEDPSGNIIGSVKIQAGAGASADFKSAELNFTVTDGATDFVVGDKFSVTVSDGVPTSAACVGTGNGTLTSVESRRGTKTGAYVLECTAAVTNGGVFNITDPDGNVIEEDITITPGAGGTASFDNDQLAGIITDGATDFAVGDTFTITVTIWPRQCIPADKAATDGSSKVYAILAEDVDASLAEKPAASYMQGEFNQRALIFASGNDIEDFREEMRDLGMYAKGSVPA